MATVARRTAALEEKLDGLVHLLHSQSQTQDHSVHDFGLHEISDNRVFEPPTPAPSTGISSKGTPSASLCYPLESDRECSEYLEAFRSVITPMCPIVCLPLGLTVDEMKEQRPFLWLVIRAVCSKVSTRQKALGLEVRKEMGRLILVENSKTLDLLLGILVYVGWGQHFICKKSNVTADLHLGMAVAGDLGLTKPVYSDQVMLNYNDQGCLKAPVGSASTKPRSMEERRALIGLFYLSSM